MLDLNKYIVKPDNHQPLHTSGLAYLANGEHIGASDNTSFSQRQQIEQTRKLIHSYCDSKIGQQRNTQRIINHPVISRQSMPTRPQSRLNVPARHAFTEPKPRSYNPYS